MQSLSVMRARVKNGRWILDEPTDLPEGTEVEIVTRAPTPVVKGSADVFLDEKLREYIHALLVAASARGVAAGPKDENELAESAKANAVRANRRYTLPEDIKKAAPDVLRRFVASDAARDIMPDDVIRAILEKTEVP